MQRAPAFLVLLLSLLYFGAGTLAMRAAIAQEEAPPSTQGPHIAVLVPLKSPALGRVADAVRRGVLEAQRVHAGTGLPVVVLASLVLGVAGGVAGAVTTAYTLKEQVLAQVREEQRRDLTFYVSREELAGLRERDRDRLDAKLDELRVEVRALSVSVARIRR